MPRDWFFTISSITAMIRFSASSLGFGCRVRNRRETSSAVGRFHRADLAGWLGVCAFTKEVTATAIRKAETK